MEDIPSNEIAPGREWPAQKLMPEFSAKTTSVSVIQGIKDIQHRTRGNKELYNNNP
jgi:hypothetical protein